MTTSYIEVYFLHCDQGMGTLVEIYDTNSKLAHLALLDLGSEAGTKKYSDTAIEAVVDALTRMKKAGFTPTIDLLLISHQDFDHWSLLPALLEKISSEVPTCQLETLYYGGTKWRKKASEAIGEWESEFGVSADPFGREATDYKTPGTKKSIKIIDGVAFRLLCANVPVSRAAVDLERNGTSAVIAVEFGGVTAVIPGDATADTIGWINDNIFAPWKKKGKKNPIQPCKALGAPHHGALRTIASNFISTSRAKLDVATTFAGNVSAQNVVASAGWYSKFNHPYKSVMEILGVKAITDAVSHDYVVYDGSTSKWQQVKASERGIFTTVQTLKDPPERTGWFFTIHSDGTVAFHIDYRQAEPVVPRTDRYPAVPHER